MKRLADAGHHASLRFGRALGAGDMPRVHVHGFIQLNGGKANFAIIVRHISLPGILQLFAVDAPIKPLLEV